MGLRRIGCGMTLLAALGLAFAGCTGSGHSPQRTPGTPDTRRPSTQTVTFEGVSFSVPAEWKILHGSCPAPYSAVYVGQPSGQSCPGYIQRPGEPPPYSMSLQTLDHPMNTGSRPITINGNEGLINDYDQWLLVVFPRLHLGVEIRYWTNHALATEILNTMRVSGSRS
jgi:hypothetical protein